MDKMTLFTALLTAADTAILSVCALVLFRGGFNAFGHTYEKPNKIRQMFGIFSLMCALAYFVFMMCYVDYILYNVYDSSLFRLVDVVCVAVLGQIPLQAIVLQQKKIQIWHILAVFGPMIPALVITLFFAEQHPISYSLSINFANVYMWIISLYSLYELRKWDEKIMNEFSDVNYKLTAWFQKIAFVNLCFTLLWIPMILFPEQRWLTFIYCMGIIPLFLRTTSLVLRQEEFAIPEVAPELPLEVSPEPEPHVAETPQWVDKMERLMTEDHIYRKTDLTSSELAKIVGTNRTYISQYLNEHLNITFYDYICGYRLDESERLLREGKLGITDIAINVGFKDRNAFYRVFRMRHNCSPSEWVKRNSGTAS